MNDQEIKSIAKREQFAGLDCNLSITTLAGITIMFKTTPYKSLTGITVEFACNAEIFANGGRYFVCNSHCKTTKFRTSSIDWWFVRQSLIHCQYYLTKAKEVLPNPEHPHISDDLVAEAVCLLKQIGAAL